MIASNYHTHSLFCDGNNTIEEMVQAAIDAQLKQIGVSSHLTLPYKNDWTMKADHIKAYLDEIARVKKVYQDKIEVLAGAEIDFFMDKKILNSNSPLILPHLDYAIFSIHAVSSENDDYSIDYTQDLFMNAVNRYYNGSVKALVLDYYESIAKMAKQVSGVIPAIIGHIDIIKKLNDGNVLFNEHDQWYQDAMLRALQAIKKTHCILEVNTAYHENEDGQYPSDTFFEYIQKNDIPITINTDAHHAEDIIRGYAKTEKMLLSKGIKKMMILKNKQWCVLHLGESHEKI